MKKSLLLFSALALFSSAYAAVGDTFDINGVTYIVKTDDTVGIKKVDSKLTEVPLSEKVTNDGVTYTVVSVEDNAFVWSEALTLTIPSTVKSLGYYSFVSSKITSISLPEGLEFIDDYAFYGCKSLTKLEIPETVTQIGQSKGSVFATCYNLQEVKLPSKIESICKSAFYNCKALKSIIIPENVKTIGDVAFNKCESLASATIPESVEAIGKGAFGDCTSLATINGSLKNVKSIGEECFFNTALTEFTIPDALEELGSKAFANTKIKKFGFGNNSHFQLIDGNLYTADLSLFLVYPPLSENTVVSVAKGCVGISGGAFQGSNVTSVTLPASVIAIDEYAFCQSSLEKITMTDNVVFIGEQAFAATNLTSLVLPQGLRTLADATFAGCEKLTSVTVGSNVKDFGIRQFWKATNFKELHFKGSNVPSVGYWEYTTEAPFYGIANKQVTIYCPKGLADNYKAEYGSFDQVGQIVDSEPGIFNPATITPAPEAEVTTLDKIALTFAEDVTVVNRTPSIKVLCGSYVGNIPMGTEVEVGSWSIIGTDKKAPRIVPLDEYGEDGNPINMEDGKEYFVIIPAGLFKNAAGDANEEITLHYIGKWIEPQYMPVSVDPADGANISEVGNVFLTFESKVYKSYGAENKIKLIKGELVDGVPVGTETMGEAEEWRINLDDCRAQIYPADLDYYLTPIKLEADQDYFFVVGAKALRNSDYVYNKQIVIRYSKNSGVSVVEEGATYAVKSGDALKVYLGEEAQNVALYNAAGVLVNSVANAEDEVSFDGLAHGLYIVNINFGKTTKAIKVMM